MIVLNSHCQLYILNVTKIFLYVIAGTGLVTEREVGTRNIHVIIRRRESRCQLTLTPLCLPWKEEEEGEEEERLRMLGVRGTTDQVCTLISRVPHFLLF